MRDALPLFATKRELRAMTITMINEPKIRHENSNTETARAKLGHGHATRRPPFAVDRRIMI
jgi:hypothetical protein